MRILPASQPLAQGRTDAAGRRIAAEPSTRPTCTSMTTLVGFTRGWRYRAAYRADALGHGPRLVGDRAGALQRQPPPTVELAEHDRSSAGGVARLEAGSVGDHPGQVALLVPGEADGYHVRRAVSTQRGEGGQLTGGEELERGGGEVVRGAGHALTVLSPGPQQQVVEGADSGRGGQGVCSATCAIGARSARCPGVLAAPTTEGRAQAP